VAQIATDSHLYTIMAIMTDLVDSSSIVGTYHDILERSGNGGRVEGQM